MLELWPVLQELFEWGTRLDLHLPAAVSGVVLGMLLGLVLPTALIGIAALAERWLRRRRSAPPPRPRPLVVRFVVPPDDWAPDLDQFTAAELAHLQRLRRAYRTGLHQPTPDRQERRS